MKSTSILGIGNDIVEIERIEEAYQVHGQRFLDRILTPKEQHYCLKYENPAPHLAGRFSAKEAIVKAFGSGLGSDAAWKEIEILNNAEGKPEAAFSGKIAARFNQPHVLLSISHCKLYVATVAIWIASDSY